MKQKIQITSISVVCLFFLFMVGCKSSVPDSGLAPVVPVEKEINSEKKPVPEPPELVVVVEKPEAVFKDLDPVSAVDLEADGFDAVFVEQRYQLYKDKELKWATLARETASLGVGFEQPEQFSACSKLVHFLSGGYQLLQSGTEEGYFVTSRSDIRFLSEDCDTVFGVQAIYLPTMLGVFKGETVERRREIVYYYHEKQDAQRVVLAVENLQEISAAHLNGDLNRIYGHALIKMGRLDDAARVLTLVVQGLDPREQWPLRLEIAELLIASGEYEEARNQYLAIAEVLSSWEETHRVVTDQLALLYATDDHTTEIALYTQCLHAYLSFDGHSIPIEFEQSLQHLQSKYADGIHADAALLLYQKAEAQTRNDVGQRLLHVQDLADEKQFHQALDELKDMKQARIPADALTRIDEMEAVVNKDLAAYIQLEKEKRIQALADRWQEGLNLLDMQMYDESIIVFVELLGTDYDRRAGVEIDKASVLAAVALRKEAANLFVRARRTQDYNGRITLLTQSRRLLQDILDKYPQVDLVEKVAVNLSVIDEQLQEMGAHMSQ